MYKMYVKNRSVYTQGDIVVVDIKQHKAQFKNSNFTIRLHSQQSSPDIV